MDLAARDWVALVGPNGCGKTTLLDTVAGRLPPLAGDVRGAGQSLCAAPRNARAALGYALPDRLTLRECLRLFTHLHGRVAPPALVDELIAAWSLTPRLDHSVDRSSLGTRQKLGVLLALVGAPRLLVLDESFNGLDPRAALILEDALEDRLRAVNFAVLLATHALELVRRHDRLREVLASQQVSD
nr:ABC transporter ATP-binding protein [Wenzhouxiangella sp. XN79A]